MSYFWVFLGGGLGSVARFVAAGLVVRYFPSIFPWGTLLVNVSGSFLIGGLAAVSSAEGKWLVGPSAWQFLIIGICGGYTTFSSFSLQTLSLARDGEWLKAGANAVLSLVLCLVAVWMGDWLASRLYYSGKSL